MSVLILGATSPIARAVANEFAAAGYAVALAARDIDEARRIASDIEIRHSVDACAVAFDARRSRDHQPMIDDVEDRLGGVEVALLAFGAMGDQQKSQREFDEARRVIEVNYTGAVSLCEKLARRMSDRGSGSIIGLTSVAGDRGRATNYIYGSAKGAFTLYLQGLRNRLADKGIDVLTVKLGFIDTRMTFGMETPLPIASPEEAGQAIVDAHRRGVDSFYFPRYWRGVMTIIKAIPERIFKHLSI